MSLCLIILNIFTPRSEMYRLQMRDELNRRSLLRGLGIAAGSTAVGMSANVTAAPNGNPHRLGDHVKSKRMRDTRQKSLVSTIQSSMFFKSVKNEMVKDGYTPYFEKSVGKILINTILNEEVEHIEIPFKPIGNNKDESARIYISVFSPDNLLVQGVVMNNEEIKTTYQSSLEITKQVSDGLIKREFEPEEVTN